MTNFNYSKKVLHEKLNNLIDTDNRQLNKDWKDIIIRETIVIIMYILLYIISETIVMFSEIM